MSDYQTTPAKTADHRSLGFFPLSVGTSLAVEGLVGIHPDLPPPSSMPLKGYDEIWVNLRTLYRNIHHACDAGVQLDITPPEMTTLLLEEMEVLPDMLKEYNGRPFKVTYYYSDYKDFQIRYPHASLRVENTNKQKLYADLLHRSMGMMKQYLKNHPDTFKLYPDKITANTTTNTLILTNIAYDLLAYKNFGKLSLLESHTGKIKPSTQFYTKYYGGRDLPTIPFMVELMQVFGDTELFSPLDIRLRKAILEIAAKREWSAVTTRARVQLGLEELQNPAHKLLMKQIFHSVV